MASRDARDEVPGTDRRPSKRTRTQSVWRDWANLTAGPAALIADRALANNITDYIRFRAACRAWRAVCVDPRAHEISDRRFQPWRWIMLPSTFNVDRRRRFVNVSTGECIHVGIPDLRRYNFLGTTAEGFLVLCQKGRHIVQLLNPITGQVTDLPCASTLQDPRTRWSTSYHIRTLCFRSAGVTNDNTVALLYNFQMLAVAKPGEEAWRRINVENHIILTALPFAGRVYCVTGKKILVVDDDTTTTSASPRLVVVADYELEDGLSEHFDRMYPVFDELGGLILVHRAPLFNFKFTAYRARLDAGSMERTHGLGGQALFVCSTHLGRSQSVPAARFSSSIKPDTVYICNDRQDVVAFDPSGTSFKPDFDKEDIAKCLLAYVTS